MDYFSGLVSPKSQAPLYQDGKILMSLDRSEYFPIQNGIAVLLDHNMLDNKRNYEMKIFDELPIHNISYFRPSLFKKIIGQINFYVKNMHERIDNTFRIVELGGGEGHWAAHCKEKYPKSDVFVCDLSLKALSRCHPELKRVCADITCPIFEKKSIHLAVFWVSLHHLGRESLNKAITEIFSALDESGVLIIFEPNSSFFIRKIMYNSSLKNDVYFDKNEKALDFSELSSIAKKAGFIEMQKSFLNPPYNSLFIKQLKHWYLYMIAVEILYAVDRFLLEPVFKRLLPARYKNIKKFFTLYGFAVYKK